MRSTSDIVNLTPSLRYFTDGPFSQPIIRGVGTQLVGQTTGTNVGTYVDGFYLPSALESDFQFNNVDNVEVLKGPQGTLFGRNTEGGAILVTTTKPSTTTHADFKWTTAATTLRSTMATSPRGCWIISLSTWRPSTARATDIPETY